MPERIVTVLGGTGFLGRRVVAALAERSATVRVAVRHPEGAPPAGSDRVSAVRADVHDPALIAAAVEGASAVVNCVSLYVESRTATFQSVHVDGAEEVARQAAAAGVGRLVHISGIGADRRSGSAYVRARGLGEERVRAAFARATIIRPSVMFGPDDAFVGALAGIIATSPVVPLFGDGGTRLQPVHVDNVAETVANALDHDQAPGETYEAAGPRVYTYRELIELIARHLGRRRLLVPLPFAVWSGLALAMSLLPSPPLTESQVELMQRDNVADPARPGLAALAVQPVPLEEALAQRFTGLGTS